MKKNFLILTLATFSFFSGLEAEKTSDEKPFEETSFFSDSSSYLTSSALRLASNILSPLELISSIITFNSESEDEEAPSILAEILSIPSSVKSVLKENKKEFFKFILRKNLILTGLGFSNIIEIRARPEALRRYFEAGEKDSGLTLKNTTFHVANVTVLAATGCLIALESSKLINLTKQLKKSESKEERLFGGLWFLNAAYPISNLIEAFKNKYEAVFNAEEKAFEEFCKRLSETDSVFTGKELNLLYKYIDSYLDQSGQPVLLQEFFKRLEKRFAKRLKKKNKFEEKKRILEELTPANVEAEDKIKRITSNFFNNWEKVILKKLVDSQNQAIRKIIFEFTTNLTAQGFQVPEELFIKANQTGFKAQGSSPEAFEKARNASFSGPTP